MESVGEHLATCEGVRGLSRHLLCVMDDLNLHWMLGMISGRKWGRWDGLVATKPLGTIQSPGG